MKTCIFDVGSFNVVHNVCSPLTPSCTEDPSSSWSDRAFYVVFFGVLIWILFSFLRSVFFPSDDPDQPPQHPPGRPPWPPFNGDGNDDDFGPGFGGGPPPPPYSPYDKARSVGYPSLAAGPQPPRSSFWTGLATGAAGMLAGQALMNRQGQQPQTRQGRTRATSPMHVDRGEGSSTGSSFRTSTGSVKFAIQ